MTPFVPGQDVAVSRCRGTEVQLCTYIRATVPGKCDVVTSESLQLSSLRPGQSVCSSNTSTYYMLCTVKGKWSKPLTGGWLV